MRNYLASVLDGKKATHSHSLVNNNETELVPTSYGNRASFESSSQIFSIETGKNMSASNCQFLLNSFHNNLVPGSIAMQGDLVLNVNSEKQCYESRVALCSKQNYKSVSELKEVAIINSETKAVCYTTCGLQASEGDRELSIAYNNVSAPHDHDHTVPDCDVMMTGSCKYNDITKKNHERYPSRLRNCEEIPVVPKPSDRCKTGLFVNACKDTSYQDSIVADVPSYSPENEAYCFTRCYLTAERESLDDEESDYELELSPTQNFCLQQQYDHTYASTTSSSQVSCTTHRDDVITRAVAESINRVDIIDTSPDYSGLVDDGGATLLQKLPLEMAKQTDTEILQVCNNTMEYSTDNTDDDFNDFTGKMQGITNPILPNQKFVNIADNLYSDSPTVEPGKCFLMEQDDHNHRNNDNLQTVPSDDQPFNDTDYDGPSKLLMVMESIERKNHHVPCSLNTWERILFSGNYYGKHLYVPPCIVLWNWPFIHILILLYSSSP